MVLGPLEYLVVGFENYRFTGQILAELRAAQEQGIIRVLDLCVIAKDEQCNVTERELFEHTWAIGLKEAIRNAGAVGGVAYAAGHHYGTKSADQQYTDVQQNAQIADLQQQQAMQQQAPPPMYQQPVYQQAAPPPPVYQQLAPPPAAPTGLTDGQIAQLQQLGALHESGVLTDAEFGAAKQKILGI
jgi:hypothetical protein